MYIETQNIPFYSYDNFQGPKNKKRQDLLTFHFDWPPRQL